MTQSATFSVHRDRSVARSEERRLQRALALRDSGGELPPHFAKLEQFPWAKGARVESTADGRQHTVVLTEERGH